MSANSDSSTAARLQEVANQFERHAPAVDFWSIRLVDERHDGLSVRQGILQPTEILHSTGAMITIAAGGGTGYAATGDLSSAGLATAARRAEDWAKRTGKISHSGNHDPADEGERGTYRSPVQEPWDDSTLEDKIACLHEASNALKIHDDIVDWHASLGFRSSVSILVSSRGTRVTQEFSYFDPGLCVIANRGVHTQRRTHGNGNATCQGGLEQLQRIGFKTEAPRVAEQALRLLNAPACPEATMDLLLLPSQMILQIHESIGHALELDRILGDERNYAGTSFVNLDMFGRYRYGSDLLNVTFDPTRLHQLASYGYDDEGSCARREHIIRNGILLRPLGGRTSQSRANIAGVANARASGWNRPPIDRMANLNLEPGDQSLEHLVASVENGVLMDTNRSWSIDDSRNKFQFGCEYARLIRDGELREVVRNPGYRGVSATFWRNLCGVGDVQTERVLGTPNCGKGEPNQTIWVGHASPACRFRNVNVFGGT